jgi:hypothetical protein
MKFNFNRNKVITYLFIAAIVFLLLNISFNLIFKEGNEKNPLTNDEINSRFRKILSDFAVKDEWIKWKEEKGIQFYVVNIPADLPVVLILNDIEINLEENVSINTVEKKINGRTFLEILSSGELKLKAEFRYNKNIFRNAVSIGLIVERLGGINDSQIEKILNTAESFAALLIPSESSEKFKDSLNAFRKEYIIILNDEINEVVFKLNPDYSRHRLILSLKEIITSFSDAIFFIVDDNSALYFSPVYPFLKEELEKRNIKLIMKSSVKSISTKTENPGETFRIAVFSVEDDINRLMIIDAEDFEKIQEEIVKLRKRGYRFINPSEIIFGG